MRYKSIEIRNYKGIKHLNLDFDKQPKSKVYTLVGLNESGKTSILEAISLLSKVIPEDKRHELIPKNKKINFNDTIVTTGIVEVTEADKLKIRNYLHFNKGYSESEIPDSFEIKSYYSFTNSTPKDGGRGIDFSIRVKKRRAKKLHDIKNDNDEWESLKTYLDYFLIPKILFYPNFLHEFPNQIIIGNEDGELQTNFYTLIIQDILHSIDPSLNIKQHVLSRLINNKKSDKEALESTLSKMSAVVTKKVFQAWGRLFKVGSKEIVISSGEIENDKTNKIDFYLEFKLKEGSDKFNISERSLGFKWFFTFLLFTEFRTNRANETGEILFLLDEPASNLHSTAQKNLIETFKEIIAKSTLIYTTHSHHLINPEWLNGAYIVRNKAIDYNNEFNYDSTNTDIEAILYKQFIAKYPNDKDYFQPILDTLDYQPGLLEKIPSIIITEGKNDYYSLKIAYRLLNRTEEFNLFPGTGVDKLYDIISLYLAWNRPFIILLDSDKAGKKAQQEYKTKYGIEVENRIFTLRDINPRWDDFTLEMLFSENDRKKLTQQFDPNEKNFVKAKFNTALQNLSFTKDLNYNLSVESQKRLEKTINFLLDKQKSL